MATEWIAYCAPGRQAIAALWLAIRGEEVAEIAEHPWLDGSTDVWLVDPAALEFTDPALTLMEPLHRCIMCRGTSEHFPWCNLMRAPGSSPSFPLTGI